MFSGTVESLRTRFAPGRRRALHPELRDEQSQPTPGLYEPPAREQELRSALRSHHDWLMGQTDEDEHGIVPAEAYQESVMCEHTMRLLGQEPTVWAPVPPSLPGRVKWMQYAIGYSADLEPLRMNLARLLADVRQVISAARPMGDGLSVTELRKVRDEVAAIAQTHLDCAKSLTQPDGQQFARRALTLWRIVGLLDESLTPKMDVA